MTVTQICSFSVTLARESWETEMSGMEIFMNIISYPIIITVAFFEVSQMMGKDDFKDYIVDFWNITDWISLFSCFLLQVCFSFQAEAISMESMRFIAAFASCFLMLKCFDWLRVFDYTGFMVELIFM